MKSLNILLILITICKTAQCAHSNQNISKSNGYIENNGQIVDQNCTVNTDVKYLLSSIGFNIQLKSNSFSYDMFKVVQSAIGRTIKLNENDTQSKIDYQFYRIDVEFIGANTSPKILATKQIDEIYNYYTAETGNFGITNVRAFKSVTYVNLYNGIDLEFTLDKNNRPKFNFIVKPGADASIIKWKYNGADLTHITNDKVQIESPIGKLEENIPFSFTNKSNIDIKYFTEDNEYFRFSIPNYDKDLTLVIDPAPWATYYGGNSDDWAHSVAIDKFGNVFSVGETNSTSNIATTGSYQSSFIGTNNDAFLVKFNSNGIKQWATYYGGSSNDIFYGVTIDSTGNIFCAGLTVSTTNIATQGSFQSTHGSNGNDGDGCIVKFNQNGSRIWGTYYGGYSTDNILSIMCDNNGNIVVTGYTNSTNGIASVNSFQPNFNTSQDGFVAKFSSSGSRIWGTYFGGTGIDGGYAITTDGSANILVTGYTVSNNGISTSNVFQQNYGGGNCDALILKLDSAGNRLWCTYYGGSNLEYGYTIKTDNNDNIIIAGTTWSQNNMTTIGAYQTTIGKGFDGFIAKFSPSGSRIWATYYGSSGYYDYILGADVDLIGNVFVTGYTNSTTGFSTTQAHQLVLGGSNDAFVAKFTSSGTRVWSTYYGGQGDEQAEGICIDNLGNPVIAGKTTSNNQMSFNNSGQTTIGLGLDAFVAAITTVGVLPVKMIYFKASLVNEISNLEWQTASETNNKEFIIERSTNNYDWSVIGTIGGQGNSSSKNIYNFVDLNTPKNTVIYYRLKQVDFDGQYSYSHVETITPIELTTNTLSVFPNPTIDFLNIKGANTRIEIYNKLGIKVLDLDGDSIIDISCFDNGIYFVVSGSQKTKFIKQ